MECTPVPFGFVLEASHDAEVAIDMDLGDIDLDDLVLTQKPATQGIHATTTNTHPD